MTGTRDKPLRHVHKTVNIICEGLLLHYFLAYKAAGGEEGKVQMEGGGHDKEVVSSKKVHSTLQCKNRYLIYDQNGGKIAKIENQNQGNGLDNISCC